MIEKEGYRIIEDADIVAACNHIELIAAEIAKQIDDDTIREEEKEMAARTAGDMFTVIAAAGVGAAVSRHQGGILLMMEGCTDAQKREAAQLLNQLKRNKAARKPGQMEVPQ